MVDIIWGPLPDRFMALALLTLKNHGSDMGCQHFIWIVITISYHIYGSEKIPNL